MPVSLTARMFMACELLLMICSVASPLTAADPKQAEPVEPAVAPASKEADQAMQGISVPAGWQIGLYASEPDVANIVNFDIDNRGRVFVCESFRQNNGVTDNREHNETWLLADLAAETVQDRIDYHKRLLGDLVTSYSLQDDRIRRLDDTDGDGKVDRSTIVANGFNRIEEGTGAGVLVRGNHIYFTCIPKLWKLTDEDDDGVAEQRVPMSDGYGVRVAFRGHDLHGLMIGPDGRLYFSIGDRGYHVATDDGRLLADPASGAVFRCELDGSGLEVFATGMRNPQELAFNDVGDLFSVDNNSDSGDRARIIQILQGGDTGWRMYYQYLPDRGPFNREKIWEPFHEEQPAYLVPPITNYSDGPSGLAYYPGTGFGDRLKNRFLLCDFRGTPGQSGVRTFQLKPEGAFYALDDDDQPIWSVLATDVAFAPDGSLMVSDWVSGWDGVGKGRLYRIVDPHYQQSPIVTQVAELLAGDWTSYEAQTLRDNLGHVDRRIRLESQWELARRGDAEPFLTVARNPQADSIARLHAIWGADHVARKDNDQSKAVVTALVDVLNDSDANLRAAAAKIMGERSNKSAIVKLRKLLADPSPRVRYFAMFALSDLNDDESAAIIVQLLEQNNNKDPAIRHAGVMFLSRMDNLKSVGALANHQSASVRRAAVVALRRKNHGDVANFLSDQNKLVALEAARAIHDVPIEAAMSTLAESVERPNENADFIRRALNANLRLGTTAAAGRVAAFAARESAPPAMRIEALDILANWTSDDPRDRVLGAHRPLSERKLAIAAKAIDTHISSLMTTEATIRERAIAVAAKLNVTKIAPQVALRLKNNELSAIERANAMQALARLDPAQALAFARTVKLQPANELTLAAIGLLADQDPAGSLATFVAATQSPYVPLRQKAWDILGNVESQQAAEEISAGIQKYLSGSLPADVHLNVLEAAQGKLSEDLQQKLDANQSSLEQSNPLAQWLVASEGGDAEAGRKLFFERSQLSCVRCHSVGLTGGKIGPNLITIAKDRDRRYLLESVCLPDATIAQGYETVIIADDDGHVYTGILRDESEDFVELVQADGIQRTIPVDQIVARRKGTSAMPADLVKQMTLRELRDLVAYLASLK